MEFDVLPHQVLIIAGPTASGKSSLAARMAEMFKGELINADTMQIYKDLPLLTAAPSFSDYQSCPHHLYQILESHQIYSVAQWRIKALDCCQEILARNKLPIVVGGTGLYLQALEKGLSPIPAIDPAIRQDLKRQLQQEGLPFLYQTLCKLDPVGAARLSSQDSHRILRCLEVIYGTSQPLHAWHQHTTVKPSPFTFKKILLSYPRELLIDRAYKRWIKMKENDVIFEVKRWLGHPLSLTSPLSKALGVKEIKEFLEHNLSQAWLDEAVLTTTRRYIKRQQTWFRHQSCYDIYLQQPNDQELLFKRV